MSLLDRVKNDIANWLLPDELFNYAQRRRLEQMAQYHDYVEGAHRKTLKVKTGKPDDNIALNLVKTVVDDSVAMLFGQEIHGNNKQVEFILENEKQNEFIQEVWDKNGGPELLFEIGDFGATYGTCYLKIIPNYYGDDLHRIVNLDPFLMRIKTNPDDIGEVWQYIIKYNVLQDINGRSETIEKKEITKATEITDLGRPIAWKIEYWERSSKTNKRWVKVDEENEWEYEFPPIIHWKNLVRAGSSYGRSDLSGNTIALQDRVNFIASNVSKIIRNHAHPKTWGKGTLSDPTQHQWGMDDMLLFPDVEAMVENLEMKSDLKASADFTKDMREVFFNITRTTDIDGLQDKIGYITNFALRVFYSDSLKKLAEKRMLYGRALNELNKRLLEISGYNDPQDTVISWPEPLPVDQKHQAETLRTDMEMEIASKETVAEERGYDWKKEKEKLEEERKEEGDLGTFLVDNFIKDGANAGRNPEQTRPESSTDEGRNQ